MKPALVKKSGLATDDSNIRPPAPSSATSSPRSILKAGVRIQYDAHSLLSSWYDTRYTDWEPDSFLVFQRFINDDSIVLDVGAWIGPTCLWLAHRAKYTVCLEPTPAAFAALQRNLQQNTNLRPDAVQLVNSALSDTKQVAAMTNYGNSMDRLDLARRRLSQSNMTHVDVTTVEELERAYPTLSRATFIKVDTEGFERRIMPALEGWLVRCKPVLFLSLHPLMTSVQNLERAVNATRRVYPYLWEADMRTPFNFVKHRRQGYRGYAHHGLSLIGTWEGLT